MPVRVTLDVILARRKLRGIQFDALSNLCLVLECAPWDSLDYDRDDGDLSVEVE
jgi:DNA-binding Xre family transcriptional regulator